MSGLALPATLQETCGASLGYDTFLECQADMQPIETCLSISYRPTNPEVNIGTFHELRALVQLRPLA
jgi:hypothetical protein